VARIAGVDLPKNKHSIIGLQYIYGIGPSLAKKILAESNIDPAKKISDLSDEEIARIRYLLQNDFKVEGAARSEVQLNIKRLMDVGCYRGIRHRKGLPVRGQRTKTNSRTRKGKRKTVAGKKKVTK
jgi:small subunit ribosomal protein S13